MTRLIQYLDRGGARHVGVVCSSSEVEELRDAATVLDLARAAAAGGSGLAALVDARRSGEVTDYQTLVDRVLQSDSARRVTVAQAASGGA